MLFSTGKNKKYMETLQIFRKHNLLLMIRRIPIGNELLETNSIIDPFDELFDMSFSEILSKNT